MKIKTSVLLLFCFAYVVASAQLQTTAKCPTFYVDLLDGIVNKEIVPTSTVGQIKMHFPCFTSSEEEGTTSKCGAGVFFKDRDIYFYTTRKYIEIGPNFKGKLSLPLMGAARSGLFKLLGMPSIKDVHWDAFQTSYGIIILYYNAANKVNKIQFSKESAKTIHLCQ